MRSSPASFPAPKNHCRPHSGSGSGSSGGSVVGGKRRLDDGDGDGLAEQLEIMVKSRAGFSKVLRVAVADQQQRWRQQQPSTTTTRTVAVHLYM